MPIDGIPIAFSRYSSQVVLAASFPVLNILTRLEYDLSCKRHHLSLVFLLHILHLIVLPLNHLEDNQDYGITSVFASCYILCKWQTNYSVDIFFQKGLSSPLMVGEKMFCRAL
jgi:hypothetical protein